MGIQYKTLVPDIHNKFVRLPGRLHRLGGFYFAEDMAILCDVLRFFRGFAGAPLNLTFVFRIIVHRSTLGDLCTFMMLVAMFCLAEKARCGDVKMKT